VAVEGNKGKAESVSEDLLGISGQPSPTLRRKLTSQSADRKAQESLPHFMDTKQERLALFPALSELLDEINEDDDPYLLYLRGLLLMRMDRRQDAIDCFTRSVTEVPYNWSCWSQMAQLVNSADMVS
jgi:anaphase-promoting complex subunit 8